MTFLEWLARWIVLVLFDDVQDTDSIVDQIKECCLNGGSVSRRELRGDLLQSASDPLQGFDD